MLCTTSLARSRFLATYILVAAGVSLSLSTTVAAQAADYIVGPQDTLTITSWDQKDMSGKYPVEPDGTFMFPLIGRVKAAGLKVREVEAELKKRLADGYFKNPEVSVAVEQYRSQRIFIVGEVRNPGAYPLTGDMTLIEALAHAGSVTSEASKDVVLVRARAGSPASAPTLPEQQDAEVLQIDFKKLESGSLAQNIPLRDGDTIFVSRAEKTMAFGFGQVSSPGSYPIEKTTTVLQALSLAGGTTDRGSTGRVRIVRTISGRKVELKANLDDLVQPGDTVVVLERIL